MYVNFILYLQYIDLLNPQNKSQGMKNNRHFQQNFEDSEMQGSGIYNTFDDNSPGRPIQLIRIRKYDQKIEVDQTALDIISNCDGSVGFCCVAGKYRTGKSFLLNKLLKIPGNGFRVDPSTVACTQGIWMWSKPLINEREHNYIFFLDTEGTASLTKDTNNDAKLFTLANLISSYLIFNTVGSIDEKSIGQLNLVTQLSKNIMLEEYADLKKNEDTLYKFMPKFLWVIRDFTLEMADRNGRRMSAVEYMESALTQENTAVRIDESTKKIRRSLVKYYVDRDCITLVRPANQQSDLRNLNSIPDSSLRRDFIEGVNAIRDKILKNAGPKRFEGEQLYGGAVASMIQSYVNSMNNGSIPSIRTAWQQINEDEGINAYDLALNRFNEMYRQNFQEDKPKGEEIYTILRVMSQAATDEFHSNITQPNELYQGKLREYLSSKEQAILQVNKQLVELRNIDILKQCMGPIMAKIQARGYDNDPNQINADIMAASQRFNEQAKGENKGQILSEFITTINPLVLDINNRSKSSAANQQDEVERLRRQFEMEREAMKKQIASLKNQAESAKNANDVKLATGATGAKRPSSTLAPTGKQIQRKSSRGCCGTGKCNIM